MIFDAIGPVASLADAIFRWVTDPEGYREWTVGRKLEKLHDASQKALAQKDFAALNALLTEYKRLSDSIV